MTLYEEWQDLLNNQTEETFEDFWKKYAGAEQKLYNELLTNDEKSFEGKLGELANKYDVEPIFMMAFLDGISESLKKAIKPEKFDENSEIAISVDYEKLYFNMQKAEADHLYGLTAWENKLSDEKRSEITKEYKKSKIYHKEETPGRNDPCPCGSGKKYKKCCGLNKNV